MADQKDEKQGTGLPADNKKAEVQNRPGSTLHLNRDPNDPRRNVPATPNLSNLNEEDPEKEPEFQNPIK
jgi:hypothetical protein